MSAEAKHVAYLVRVATVTIGAIVATHTMLETGRDTLFLERIPVSQLPWMYVAVAVLSAVIAFTPSPTTARRWGALPILLLGASAGSFVFWALSASPTHALYYALYVWTALCGATAVTQFWTTMASIFTLVEAKRLFAVIGVGAVAGGAVGAGLARLLFVFTGARSLVLFAALGFAASSVPATLLRPPPKAATTEPPRVQMRDELPAAGVAWRSPYLASVGRLAVATAVTATVLDFAFKRAIVRHFDASEIGPIIASVSLVSNTIGGLAQVFLVPRILAAVGTARSLRLLPGVLAFGALAGIALPYTFVVIGLRAIDGIFRYSLQRTATELLYVPISEAIRRKVKTMLDVVTQRGGQAVASLALLAVPATLHTRYLVLAIALCSLIWFALAVQMRPKYLALFRSMVHEGALESLEAFPALDQQAVEGLVAALSSERDEKVVFALDVLAERGKAKLIPTLILFHPSSRVVIRALEIFATYERRDAASLAWRLVDHADPAVSAQAVHAVSALDFRADRLRELSARSDAHVATTALVELWARGDEREEERARVAELLSPSGDPEAQRLLLRALATTQSRRLLIAALPLAERATLDVQIEIARALQRDPIPEGLRALVPMLAHWPTRDPARRAMVALGAPALEELVRLVGDFDAPAFARIHAPRSISRFAPDVAVPILLPILVSHPEGIVRYKALRGLGRLATDGALVRIDEPTLERLVGREIERAQRSLDWSERLMKTPEPGPEARRVRELLVDLIREKGEHAAERLFRVIALRYRGEDWERIFEGFRGRRYGASRELVEGLLREPLRGQLLGLIDRVGNLEVAPGPSSEPIAPLVQELASAGDHVLGAVATYYARVAHVDSAPLAPVAERVDEVRSAD